MTSRPPIPDPPHVGGCLCGAVRYRLETPPLAINACHCADCKKLSGATHLLMLNVAQAGFSAAGRTDVFRKQADSGRQVDIYRCAACGTRLWHAPLANPELMFVAAGTLDDPSWAVPTSHIWIERVSPGVAMEPDALQVVGQPTTRQMLMDAFRALHGVGADTITSQNAACFPGSG